MSQDDDTNVKNSVTKDEDYDPFVKPKDAAKVGRYTPLHWASYKNHINVVWILLKNNVSIKEIDNHGNQAVHHAAAIADPAILKCFMSKGVDINLKNARGHEPIDLATVDEVRKLIVKAQNTLHCKGNLCDSSVFDFKNIRHFCTSCTEFFCRRCSVESNVKEHYDSEFEERPVRRCMNCLKKIKESKEELEAAMESRDFFLVDKVFTRIKNEKVDIDAKLFHDAEVLHLKLEK